MKLRTTVVLCSLFVLGALLIVGACSEKFMQPKNGAGQVEFSSTCLTGQVGNKVNVTLCLMTLLTHLETEYMSYGVKLLI